MGNCLETIVIIIIFREHICVHVLYSVDEVTDSRGSRGHFSSCLKEPDISKQQIEAGQTYSTAQK